MKRANFVFREGLLEEATQLSGEKTYSATVTRALEELIARAKARRIADLFGSGLWEGELPVMRADRPRAKGRGVLVAREKSTKWPKGGR